MVLAAAGSSSLDEAVRNLMKTLLVAKKESGHHRN
jgi:hypothetical protein